MPNRMFFPPRNMKKFVKTVSTLQYCGKFSKYLYTGGVHCTFHVRYERFEAYALNCVVCRYLCIFIV
jgi:hypothetical protein